MQDPTITLSNVQLILSVLGFAAVVVLALFGGGAWLERRRSLGDSTLHGRVDVVSKDVGSELSDIRQSHAAAVSRIREEFVPKTDFQRLEDRLDDELKGLRSDIKGEFGRLNDRFDRLLADGRQPAGLHHGD